MAAVRPPTPTTIAGPVFPQRLRFSSTRIILRDFLLTGGLYSQNDSSHQRRETLLMPPCHEMRPLEGAPKTHTALSFFKQGNRSQGWNDLPKVSEIKDSKILWPTFLILHLIVQLLPTHLAEGGKDTFLLHFNWRALHGLQEGSPHSMRKVTYLHLWMSRMMLWASSNPVPNCMFSKRQICFRACGLFSPSQDKVHNLL